MRGDVSALGRILSYNPIHTVIPPRVPLDVPTGMLSPQQLLNAYDALPLGATGAGGTVVFFEIDADKALTYDLNKFSDRYGYRISPRPRRGTRANCPTRARHRWTFKWCMPSPRTPHR